MRRKIYYDTIYRYYFYFRIKNKEHFFMCVFFFTFKLAAAYFNNSHTMRLRCKRARIKYPLTI